jgi:hypothetical protein
MTNRESSRDLPVGMGLGGADAQQGGSGCSRMAGSSLIDFHDEAKSGIFVPLCLDLVFSRALQVINSLKPIALR